MRRAHLKNAGGHGFVLLLAAAVLFPMFLRCHGSLPQAGERREATPWFISAEVALLRLRTGARLIDARPAELAAARFLPGSIALEWQDLARSDPPSQAGLLQDGSAAEVSLRARGVPGGVPLIVVGDTRNSWGEDGRVAWSLRTLGARQTFIVDGGADALLAAGWTAAIGSEGLQPPDVPFEANWNPRWNIDREGVRTLLAQRGAVFVDARAPEEFAGATPFGESRGGRLPGAVSLHFRDLIAPDGRLASTRVIQQVLERRGVRRDQLLIAYCTGGVRSAWLVAALSDAGYVARNYAGSMWEWSFASEHEYPLIR